MNFRVPLLALGALPLAFACSSRGSCTGDYCGTVVFVTANNPKTLLPTELDNAGGRDVVEQLFLRLADMGMTTNTVGDSGFVPRLATRWEWDDPKTLVFHLDPRARWQDSVPVTANDVAFTFDAYRDPVVNSSARNSLSRIASVTVRDSVTAVFRFKEQYPTAFYDAVYQMWIIPQHLLAQVPRTDWLTASFGQHPIGDGPYKFVSMTPGQTIELVADSTFFEGRPHIRRLVWKIVANLSAAVNDIVTNQADALDFLGSPANIDQVKKTPGMSLIPYPGSNYMYVELNTRANGDSSKPHPVLGDRDVRRALTMALDRQSMAANVMGSFGKVPPGPIPQWWPIWDSVRTLPFDSAGAARMLSAHGWRLGPDGIRVKDSVRCSFEVIFTATSGARAAFARLMQAQWKAVGVDLQIQPLDQNLIGDRLASGQFDAVIQAFNSDPTPTSGIAQHWTHGAPNNYSHWSNPDFDRMVDQATAAPTVKQSRIYWRAALNIINADAPGIWLAAPDNVAAVSSRIIGVKLRPDSYWALAWTWRIPPDRLIDRDR